MKKIIILALLVGASFNINAQDVQETSETKLGLMPYAALTRTQAGAEIAGEEETATGYEIGVEYEWLKEGLWHSGSRLTLKNLNTDAGVMGLYSYEMEMNILSIGQSITYDFDMGGNILRPFATVDLGLGLAKTRAEIFDETYESETETLPYANLSIGTRYIIGNIVPFVTAGYQYAQTDINQVSDDFSAATEIDYSGTYFSVGVGMIF